jgi:hypothetical protein
MGTYYYRLQSKATTIKVASKGAEAYSRREIHAAVFSFKDHHWMTEADYSRLLGPTQRAWDRKGLSPRGTLYSPDCTDNGKMSDGARVMLWPAVGSDAPDHVCMDQPEVGRLLRRKSRLLFVANADLTEADRYRTDTLLWGKAEADHLADLRRQTATESEVDAQPEQGEEGTADEPAFAEVDELAWL